MAYHQRMISLWLEAENDTSHILESRKVSSTCDGQSGAGTETIVRDDTQRTTACSSGS